MKIGTLKKTIPKGTEIYDIYNDRELFYKIGNTFIPIDFNNGKHSEYIQINEVYEM